MSLFYAKMATVNVKCFFDSQSSIKTASWLKRPVFSFVLENKYLITTSQFS